MWKEEDNKLKKSFTFKDFKEAWEAKDIDALIGLLDPEATAIADSGGRVLGKLDRDVRKSLEVIHCRKRFGGVMVDGVNKLAAGHAARYMTVLHILTPPE